MSLPNKEAGRRSKLESENASQAKIICISAKIKRISIQNEHVPVAQQDRAFAS